ncbi:hypothetical protein N7501_003700 [Penicillium viridicatum]|nr:hypothetical protein N7501_003700 [Penicillium viridicatum]
MYPGKLRNARWPADFNTDGDIVPERWPMGDAVVLWMHGLPFLPVFSGYYLLIDLSRKHRRNRNRGLLRLTTDR